MKKQLLRKFRPSPKLKGDTLLLDPPTETYERPPEPVEDYAATFGNTRPALNAISQSNLISLQRSIGNQAVQRLLAERHKIQRAGETAEPEEISGKLPDHNFTAPKSMVKGPPSEEFKSDKTQNSSKQSKTQPAKDNSQGGDIQIVMNDIDFDFKSPETDPAAIQSKVSRQDSINASTITLEFNNPGNKVTTPFGEEAFEPGYSDGNFNITGKKKKTVNLSFKLVINAPWGTNAGGAIDVPSATDGIVTAEKQPGKSIRVFQKIAKDLKPVKQEKSWVAPRSIYWAKALCERHERFHSTDDWAWVQSTGKNLVKNYLNSKKVSSGNVGGGLVDRLDKAMTMLENANFQFYTGGSGSYYSYAGEERAFGDGKVPYQNLSQAVRAHGMTLMPAKLVQEVGALLDAGDITAVNWATIKKLTDKWPTLLAGLKADGTIQAKMAAKVSDAFNGPFTRAKADAIENLYNSTVADKADLKTRLTVPLNNAILGQLTAPYNPAKEAVVELLKALPFAEVPAIKTAVKDRIVTLVNEALDGALNQAKISTINELYNSCLADKPDIQTRTAAALNAAVDNQLALPITQAKVDIIKQYTDLPIADVAAIKAAATDKITTLITGLVGDKTHKVKQADLDMISLLYNCTASDKAAVKNACLPLKKNFVLIGNRRKFIRIFE